MPLANTDAASLYNIKLLTIYWIHLNIHNHLMYLLFSCRDVSVGDNVTVGECRPLSKTVRFNVLKVTKAAGAKKQFQKF